LLNNTLWSVTSNALVKSTNKTLMIFCELSEARNNSCIIFQRECVVERLSSVNSSKYSLKWRLTNFSAIFASELLTAIGHKLLSILTGRYNFGIGVILASFHWSGTMPWRTELLIIEVTGGARDVANSFKILWGTLSGPTALVSLILLSPVCTSSTYTIYSDGIGGRLSL